MIPRAIASLCYPPRTASPIQESSDDIAAYIESRALKYPSQLEDDFVNRALKLGVESGTILDVGTHVGLIALKLLWQNENLISIGLDRSGPMIEQARATAESWEIGSRAVFQVGDPRQMRFKSGYFDMVVSDSSLHRFDDASAVLREIGRVLKPRGALLIRDFRRPNRFRMTQHALEHAGRFGDAMRPQIEAAIRSSFTETELMEMAGNEIPGIQMVQTDPNYITIERRGENDPNSWVVVRDQYR